jgi:hypothetical protein
MKHEQTIAYLEAKIQELKNEVQKLKSEDKNAFIKTFEVNPSVLSDFSEQAFGCCDTIQIAHGSVRLAGRADLYGRALYIQWEHQVILHKDELFGGTVIEIQEK